MKIDDKIRDEKLQYDIKRETVKISALSSGKIDKYEYLTREEVPPPDQGRLIEQAKFAYSPLIKAFEKQTKRLKSKRKKNRCYYKLKRKSRGFNQWRWSQKYLLRNIS